MPIEKEFKFLVTSQKFDKLKKYLLELNVKNHCVSQTNTYYDTNNLDLDHNKNTLKIRTIENINYVFYKGTTHVDSNHLQTRIDSNCFTFIGALPTSIILNDLTLNKLGSLTTYRQVFYFNNYSLYFDKNIYFKKIDFEIEIEVNNCNESIDTIISSLGKEWRFLSGQTSIIKRKYERFLSAYKIQTN